MTLVGFEPTILTRARLQTYALDRAATEIGPDRIAFLKIHDETRQYIKFIISLDVM
jgi:hypothetical protein